MAACDPFKISFQGSAEELFEKIKKLVQENGGTISGNSSGGSLSVSTPVGKVDADYSVSGQECTITITKKPFLLSCSAIESFIKGHIPSVDAADMDEFV